MDSLKNVLLYRIGRLQEDFEYMFDYVNVIAYLLDESQLIEYNGKKCYNFSNINEINFKKYKIIICDRKNKKILDKFNTIRNVTYGKNLFFIEDIAYLLNDKVDEIGFRIINKYFSLRGKKFEKEYISNEQLFKKMIYADSKYDIKCKEPFEYVNIQPYGFVHSCCPSYGYNVIGNLLFKSGKRVFNSNAAKLQRLSIINKTFIFCNDKTCPIINKNKEIDIAYNKLEHYNEINEPTRVYLSFDESCNLKCRSCRMNFYTASGLGLVIRKYISHRFIKSKWWKKSKTLVIAGEGEAFYSKIYLKLLFDSPITSRDSIDILSNGILLDNDKLDKLLAIYKRINIGITVDAAKKGTYMKIRGGNFDKLCLNLSNISKARKQGKICNLELLFVVQKNNYSEMEDFISFAKKYNADKVVFSQITNWGTYSEEEFKDISMLDTKGNIKPELKLVLNNKSFRKKEISKVSNIGKFI